MFLRFASNRFSLKFSVKLQNLKLRLKVQPHTRTYSIYKDMLIRSPLPVYSESVNTVIVVQDQSDKTLKDEALQQVEVG